MSIWDSSMIGFDTETTGTDRRPSLPRSKRAIECPTDGRASVLDVVEGCALLYEPQHLAAA
ncbi:hypothetical protein [Arthrobacter sp.]|uniref:hypothetical protein n=1 Tax=Arthrobacter sp. TaxID=1667 RepID=UPI00281252AE|nr:hypothetical protein [Arthrobacter sp.]